MDKSNLRMGWYSCYFDDGGVSFGDFVVVLLRGEILPQSTRSFYTKHHKGVTSKNRGW